MSTRTRHARSIPRASSLSRLIALVIAGMTSTSAHADDTLDTAYYLARMPYVVLKRAHVACGRPADEHVDYMIRMLRILGEDPAINLQEARRGLELAYKLEADIGASACTDALQARYKSIIDRGIDADLEHLRKVVRNRRR